MEKWQHCVCNRKSKCTTLLWVRVLLIPLRETDGYKPPNFISLKCENQTQTFFGRSHLMMYMRVCLVAHTYRHKIMSSNFIQGIKRKHTVDYYVSSERFTHNVALCRITAELNNPTYAIYLFVL